MAVLTATIPLRLTLLAVCLLLAGSPVAAEKLSLQEAGTRRNTDYSPLHAGREVTVEGRVAAAPVSILDYAMLAIQDDSGYGLFLLDAPERFAGMGAGDRMEVRGTIAERAGLPVLRPEEIRLVGKEAATEPIPVRYAELRDFRHLGALVTTEAKVIRAGANTGGEILQIGERDRPLRVFLPWRDGLRQPELTRFRDGDVIRVTGLASQYCALPPYDREFEILIGDAAAVELLAGGWIAPPSLLLTAVLSMFLASAIWWMRGRGVSAQQRRMRALNALSEEIVAAGSASEILGKLQGVLPRVLGISRVRIYLHNRGSRSLEAVGAEGEAGSTVRIDAAAPASSVALCFRNRVLIAIPDTRKSAYLPATPDEEPPLCAMCVPMLAQGDLLGVLELRGEEAPRGFRTDEKAAAQHLANQVAAALKLAEQKSIREQLFRSEKLAAAGQLISGVANELRTPLETILRVSDTCLARVTDPMTRRDLRAVAAEARRASAILARLVSFARPDQTEAGPVDLNELMGSLLEFRAREWEMLGIRVRNLLAPEPVIVLAAQGQLEQVFLNLLIHAEQSVAATPQKTVTVGSRIIGHHAIVEIRYPSRSGRNTDPFDDSGAETDGSSLGFQVCRGIVRNHGGEVRHVNAGAESRFEVELPVQQAPPVQASRRARSGSSTLTLLLVEPVPAEQRRLVSLLSARRHRVVPVGSGEEAYDLAQRMRFDGIFCSLRLPGMNWVGLSERLRHQPAKFVLITEGYDSEMTRTFSGSGGHVLRRPVEESELDGVLAAMLPAETNSTSRVPA